MTFGEPLAKKVKFDVSRGACGCFRYAERPKPRIGVVVLARKRPWPSCPNPQTGREWREEMLDRIHETFRSLENEIEVVGGSDGVDIPDDPTLRKEVARLKEIGVDVLVAIQPTIGDGRLAPVLSQVWGHHVIFWATPEEQTGEMISGNSLVGTHLMSATLRQLGRPFEIVYGNLDWTLSRQKLSDGIAVAYAVRMLAQSKIGLIGGHVPGFQDFHPDPFVMSKTFGCVLQLVQLPEYLDRVKDLPEQDVLADVAKVKATVPFKKGPFGHSEDELPLACRHYLAMRQLSTEENFDALAIRCWPELPTAGMWPYTGLARLATEGFPAACEGDVDGALSILVGKLLGGGVVYLSDWLEHDAHTLTLWHGGVAPFQLSESVGTPLGPCLSRHFNNKMPGCMDATIKIGMDVTVYRFWVCDGRYHLVCMEGTTIQPKRHLLGNNGLVELSKESGINLLSDFDKWVHMGFPHHVCVVEGHIHRRLVAFARETKVSLVTR